MLVDKMLQGRFDESQSNEQQTSLNRNKVVVFVSSTFTDTKTERNALIRGLCEMSSHPAVLYTLDSWITV